MLRGEKHVYIVRSTSTIKRRGGGDPCILTLLLISQEDFFILLLPIHIDMCRKWVLYIHGDTSCNIACWTHDAVNPVIQPRVTFSIHTHPR